MSKYIIDVDALKECLNLLPKRYDASNYTTVRIDDVINMIDNFPKDPPINYTYPIISTSPAVVPDTLKGWEVSCEADKEKLKNATKFDLMEEINLIDEELSNAMYPISFARTKKLLEYKDELKAELKRR